MVPRSTVLRASLLFAFIAGNVFCQDFLEKSAEGDSDAATEVSDQLDKKDPSITHDFSDTELQMAHVFVDENSDKEASHDELIGFVEKHKTDVMLDGTDPWEELKRQDTSGDERVSLEEHLNEDKNITPEERAEKEEIFKAADTNGDGVLDKDEMPAVLSPETHDHTLGIVNRQTFSKADGDHDGKLSFSEFQEADLAAKAKGAETAEEEEKAEAEKDKQTANPEDPDKDSQAEEQTAKTLYERLDTNHDGSLDQDELRPLASGQIQRQDIVDNLVKSVDKDGDKQVDYAELVEGKSYVHDSELQDYLVAWAKRKQILGR